MAEIKTKLTTASVTDFINKADPKKKKDAQELLKIFKKITGEKPQVWGNTTSGFIGFGKYHYKSQKSTQEGYWPLTGFSPRKQNLTLYIMGMYKSDEFDALLKKLGKHKKGGGCLYINKLADVDQKVLNQLIKKSYIGMKKKHKA